MGKKVVIGAASANQAITDIFGGASFPLEITVTNLMPRSIVLPDVRCLSLTGCNSEGATSSVTVAALANLQALASNIQQIAVLNGYGDAMVIEEKPAPDAVPDAAPKSRKSKAAE